MIITLEGAPAVGKSTIARELESGFGFKRIPEVNELTKRRPENESPDWYAKQQLKRMSLTDSAEKSVFDGDPFQAVWFSWMYPERINRTWREKLQVFVENKEAIVLPDRYCYLSIDQEIRFERELIREQERGHSDEQFRRKWERYETMPGKFESLVSEMAKTFEGWVVEFETDDQKRDVGKIGTLEPKGKPSPEEFVSWLEEFLNTNSGE